MAETGRHAMDINRITRFDSRRPRVGTVGSVGKGDM
jgi:hypothetical protein